MTTLLITGGSRGIGKATAEAFARMGATVLFTYYQTPKDEVRALVARYKKLGAVHAQGFPLDMLCAQSMSRLWRDVVEEGDIHFLIHNAGVIDWTPFDVQTSEAIERLCRVNLEGVIKVTLKLLPYIQTGIISVASDVGTNIHAGLLVYSTTKAGLIAFTRGLAELRPELRIYSVSPDKTATAMNEFEGRDPQEVAERVVAVALGAYDAHPPGSDITMSTPVTP